MELNVTGYVLVMGAGWVGGNGVSNSVSATSTVGSLVASSSTSTSDFDDGIGSFLIFNVGAT